MDNIVSLTKSDIISIIKQCKASKVKKIKLQGLELEFHEPTETPKRVSQKKVAEIDARDAKEDLSERTYEELEESWIANPSAETEQMLIDMSNNGNRLQDVV